MRKRRFLSAVVLVLTVIALAMGAGMAKGNVVFAAAGTASGYGNPTVDEQVIYDQDNIKILAAGITSDDKTGNVALKLKLENGSESDLMVQGTETYVNGLAVDATVYVSAKAGETEESESLIMGYSMGVNGIDKIASIELVLSGYDSAYNEVFRTDLLKINTSLEGSFSQSKPEGKEALSIQGSGASDVKIFYNGFHNFGELQENEAFAEFYIENNSSSKNYYFYSLDISVNGKSITGALAQTLRPGKAGVVLYGVYKQFLEAEGIKNIEEVSGVIDIIEGETYALDRGAGSVSFDIKPETTGQVKNKNEETYNYFGLYADGVYIEAPDVELDPWYVTLRKDGGGYLYLGDDNQGELESYSGEGDDFVLKAGVSVFEGSTYLQDGVMRLDFDAYTLVFLSPNADRSKLKAITVEEYQKKVG